MSWWRRTRAGTRDVQSSISSSNVNKLGVAWTVPITGKLGIFGNFAATPVVVGGVVYLQDLNSGVWAVKLSTGKLLWHTPYNSSNTGPDGVNVVGGKVYGATASKAFALSAATGEQLWSKKLIRNKGEGIDMAPAVNDGTVDVSTVPGNNSGFYTGDGVAVLWAMNAATGAVKWSGTRSRQACGATRGQLGLDDDVQWDSVGAEQEHRRRRLA